MRWLAPCFLLAVIGCASPPPPPVTKPLFVDGVMQRELTPKEAERYLRKAVPDFDVCYRRELLNFNESISSYVFEVYVPADGTPAEVVVQSESVPNQVVLRDCLVEAIERVKFPAHLGKPITLKVPIEGG